MLKKKRKLQEYEQKNSNEELQHPIEPSATPGNHEHFEPRPPKNFGNQLFFTAPTHPNLPTPCQLISSSNSNEMLNELAPMHPNLPTPCQLMSSSNIKNLTSNKMLKELFSQSNIHTYHERQETSSNQFHIGEAKRKSRFVHFDSHIGESAKLYRYNLTQMKMLLTPLTPDEKHELTEFKCSLENRIAENDPQLTKLQALQNKLSVYYDRLLAPQEISSRNSLDCVTGISEYGDVFKRSTLTTIATYILRDTLVNEIKKGDLGFRYAVVGNKRENKVKFSIGTSGDSMSHSQLVCGKESDCKCLAAGNIHFQYDDNNHLSIAKISNHTGHFKCPPASLLFLLSSLLQSARLWFGHQVSIELLQGRDKSIANVEVNNLNTKCQHNLNEGFSFFHKNPHASSSASSGYITPPRRSRAEPPHYSLDDSPSASSVASAAYPESPRQSGLFGNDFFDGLHDSDKNVAHSSDKNDHFSLR